MTPDTSIILKGLTPLVKPSVDWVVRKIVGEEILERRQFNATALQPVLQRAVENIAEVIELIGKAGIEQIYFFLTSSEAEAIVRQIYAASILESQEQNLEQIKQEFLKSFSLYTTIPEDDLKDSAPQIFYTLVEGCEATLQIAIDEGRLSAHEAKSVFRHQILYDELASVKKNLEFLTKSKKLDVKAILDFENKYRQQAIIRHGAITPPFMNESKKIPIDDIYVVSNVVSGRESEREQRRHSKRQAELTEAIYRDVLLGNPGAGKSTFAQKLTYDLAKNYDQRILNNRRVTPILVVLRKYGVKKKSESLSILEFIEQTIKSDYQLPVPPGALEYLLLNGRASVIFDGLDELTDTSDRQEISNDVECFGNLYPAVPILVTSREVGYKEAPLNESKFKINRLAPFDSEQVEDYVTKWFKVAFDSSDEEQKQSVAAFLSESEAVLDLRSNPLMLGLMCNIYRGEGYIPRNRPDVYQKCADMMFERWDKGRKIFLPKPIEKIESKVRPTMMYLANWIYSEESLQEGVTERKLIAQATEYLLERSFDDRDDAEQAAKNLIEFCRGRAWVFTDTGTTKDGEKLYQFTHRTFLEYFTAAYLNRTNNTSEKLFNVLISKIAKQEWDVVCQLAFQIRNKNDEYAGDELLSLLIEEAKVIDNFDKWNILYFSVRCLEFIIPSPKVLKNIVNSCLEICVSFGITAIENNNKIHLVGEPYPENLLFRNILPGGVILALSNANHENRRIILNTFKKFIINNLKSTSELETCVTIEIFVLCTTCYPRRDNFLHKIKQDNEVLSEFNQSINRLASVFAYIGLLSFHRNQLNIIEMIAMHGVESIFAYYRSVILPARVSISVCDKLIQNYLSGSFNKIFNIEDSTNYLSELGKKFTSRYFSIKIRSTKHFSDKNTPYRGLSNLKREFIHKRHKNNYQENNIALKLDANKHFGFCCLFFGLLEIQAFIANRRLVNYANMLIESRHKILNFSRYIFIARFSELGKYDREVKAELDTAVCI